MLHLVGFLYHFTTPSYIADINTYTSPVVTTHLSVKMSSNHHFVRTIHYVSCALIFRTSAIRPHSIKSLAFVKKVQ